MKILILIEIASFGGHVLSAFTTAKELRRRGHEVHFAGGGGPMQSEIEKFFPFYELTYYYEFASKPTYFTWKSLVTLKQLSALLVDRKYDHIHAFDARSHIIASLLSTIKRIPVTCTLCGGVAPYDNIPLSEKLIVFSKEQKAKLVNVFGWKENNIEVISTRLDMEQFENIQPHVVNKLCHDYQINPSNKNIMMITNFIDPKVPAIKHVLDAIPAVLDRFSDVNLIMIGGRGRFFQEAQRIGENINGACGRKAIIFIGPVMYAQRLLPAGYIVLGVGRSAFEGMAYEKPTLIVGEKGFAGTVGQGNIDKISHFNFSGRNNKTTTPPELLARELTRLLTDNDYYESVRHFGVDFLKKNIDIKSGILRIENVYKLNTVYNEKRPMSHKVLNLSKVLLPMLGANHYAQLKFIIKRFFG